MFAHPGLDVIICGMTTSGDQQLEHSLSRAGGKGLFVKELEQALLEGRADLAVHSMKDVPAEFPAGLCLAAITEREDPRDALILRQAISVQSAPQLLDSLPQGARIGTSSLRRACQLKALRPDLRFVELRGNVQTRLNKLVSEHLDAIVLAVAGLKRLGLVERISYYLETEVSLPAIGQGALGIECRSDDKHVQNLIAVLQHLPTYHCVMAERSIAKTLSAGCHAPVAGYAVLQKDNSLWLRGRVGRADGSQLLSAEVVGPASVTGAEALGIEVANKLLQQGAEAILKWES